MARKKYPPHPGVIEREDGSIAVFSKRCTECRITKNLDEFSPKATMRDGRQSRCRPCRNTYLRETHARRRAAGLCRVPGCPEHAAEGRGGRCDAHAVADAAYLRDRRARRGEAGLCRECALPAAEDRAYCAAHLAADRARYAADPEAKREAVRARLARLAARSDDEIAADLATVLAKSPDGLLPCRAGHRAPAEDFPTHRMRRSGKHDYCRAHIAERDADRHAARPLPSWVERDLYACTYCGAPYEHADHLHALANGGPDVPRNLAPACAACNLSKSATPVDVWLDRLAREGDPRGVRREVWADWPRVVLDVADDGTVFDVATGEVVEVAS